MTTVYYILGASYNNLPADFNDALTTGTYRGDTNNKSNCPTSPGQYFSLYVFVYSGYITQIGISIPGSDLGEIFYRQRSGSGTWRSWKALAVKD